jgi:2-hydroxychromene-2-carboxylate isomerase
MFARLWVEGRDITPVEAVAEEATALGLDAKSIVEAATSEAGKKALHDAVAQAIERGVFGTPFFIADGEPIWGCDRLWMLDHWLKHKNWDGAGARALGL